MSTPPNDEFLASLVGRPLDEATWTATEAGWQVRPCTPGSMLTMDYREGRVNLEHDEDGIVTRAWMG